DSDRAIAHTIASAPRDAPVREGIAAFGEIGLTGRLRQASQSERRLEECAKLGIVTVVVPARTTARSRRTPGGHDGSFVHGPRRARDDQGGDHRRARGGIAFRGGRRVGYAPVALP